MSSQPRASGYFRTAYDQDFRLIETRLQRRSALLFAVALIVFPYFASAFYLDLANQVFLASMGALSLMLLTGFAGQISLGHAGLLAAGAFTVGILFKEWNAPFWITLPAAALVGALLGVVFGLPSLRLRGLYLAVSTLALHFVVVYLGGEYETKRGYSGLRFVLRRARTVELTVVEAGSGTPVLEYAVQCLVDPTKSERLRELRQGGRHEQGRVVVEPVRRGTNRLVVHPQDRALLPSEDILFEVGEGDIAPLRVEVERMPEFVVHVRSSDGVDLAGTKVEVIALGTNPLELEEPVEDRFQTNPQTYGRGFRASATTACSRRCARMPEDARTCTRCRLRARSPCAPCIPKLCRSCSCPRSSSASASSRSSSRAAARSRAACAATDSIRSDSASPRSGRTYRARSAASGPRRASRPAGASRSKP